MMLLGVCADINKAELLAAAGCDYVEGNVFRNLVDFEDEAAFDAFCKTVSQSPLPMPVVNGFIPGALKIVGPDADPVKLRDYVALALRRAAKVGVEVIVFGSGGARKIPEGVSRDDAWQQLVAFTRMVAAEAEKQGVTVVVEPLNKRECNVITSVAEGARLVCEVDHPNIRLLVDGYHWACDNGTVEEIVDNADLVCHVHVATKTNRKPPGFEKNDWETLFAALRKGGYDGRISIEAKWDDLETQVARAVAVLRDVACLN